MHRFLLTLLVVFPVSAWAEDRYRVQFSDRLETVQVEACFDGPPPKKLYRNERSRQYTDWVRSGGRPIRHTGRHLQLVDLPDDACVAWQVDLSGAAARQDYRLALQWTDVFLGSGDLWFWRDDERRPIRVSMHLPAGHSISTPWRPLADKDGGRSFRVDPTPASWSSRIAIGRFAVAPLLIGGAELRVAVIRPAGPDGPGKFIDWIAENAASVAAVHGRIPQESPQVLVVPIGPRSEPVPWAHVIRGGGAAVEFFVDETRSLQEFRFDWTAPHELSHLLLPLVSSRDRWLSEGLASYYQNVLRARDGRLTEEQAWQKLHAGFERGRKATHGATLEQATRSGRGATMRVYWSGAAMMLKADARLRALSGGRWSLDTALGALAGCCMEPAKSWRAEEILEELDRLTGHRVFREVFEDHVQDRAFPDLGPVYRQLGLREGSPSVSVVAGAPWSDIRQSIMGG
jgi:hypothetical protein